MFFYSLTLVGSLLGQIIFPNLANSQELEPANEPIKEPEPFEKKSGAGAEAAWEKVGAGAAKKVCGSTVLIKTKKVNFTKKIQKKSVPVCCRCL